MRLNKKHIKVVLLILALLVLFSTLFFYSYSRYITQLSAVFKTNIIALGQVEISLAETKVDEYGVPLTGSEAGTTSSGQSYKLIPGCTYVKDPFITVAKGSNPCWLFVKVENGISIFEEESNTIYDQMIKNGWIPLEGEANIYYHDIVDAFTEEKIVKVFEEFTIHPAANAAKEWDTMTPENTKVTIRAFAIQAEGFDSIDNTKEENVKLAWAALN